MKITTILFVLSLFGITQCQSQSSGNDQIEEVKQKLKSGSTVSTILTDKNFLSLHPERNFRNLVKESAETGSVSIAPLDEPGKKINIICQVTDANGKGIEGVLIYLYQTDGKG